MKSWAIVVGINQYPERAGQRVLKGAVADAADFADWALDPRGGAVDPERLFFWTHPEPDNPTARLAEYLDRPTPWWDLDAGTQTPDSAMAPRKDEIVETALAAAKAARVEAQEEDDGAEVRRIYVFFAGHGLQTITSGSAIPVQTCFVTGDFRPEASTVMGLIPCEDLHRALLNGGFDEVYMFLDCCRVAMTKLNMPAPSILSANSRSPPSPVYCVGNAAGQNKIAFEIEEPPPPRGAFSKTLLEGLRTVRDTDSTLTVQSLKVYVYKNIGVPAGQEQYPDIQSKPDNPSPVVLIGPPIQPPAIRAPIRISFDTVAAGTEVQLADDKGDPVGRPIVAGPKPIRVSALADRFYSLDVIGTAISKPFKHSGPGVTDVSL